MPEDASVFPFNQKGHHHVFIRSFPIASRLEAIATIYWVISHLNISQSAVRTLIWLWASTPAVCWLTPSSLLQKPAAAAFAWCHAAMARRVVRADV